MQEELNDAAKYVEILAEKYKLGETSDVVMAEAVKEQHEYVFVGGKAKQRNNSKKQSGKHM